MCVCVRVCVFVYICKYTRERVQCAGGAEEPEGLDVWGQATQV